MPDQDIQQAIKSLGSIASLYEELTVRQIELMADLYVNMQSAMYNDNRE